jgi:hypothetical protein
MLRKSLFAYAAAGLLAVAIGQGVASAQAPGTPAPAPTLPPGGAVPGMSKQVSLTPQQQVQTASSYITSMEAVRKQIRVDLEDARQRRDVVKTLCLNDKLNQIDVALRSANDRLAALNNAAGRGDGELANHEFTILSVLNQRGQQLDAEAKQCIGKEIGIVGESSTTMEPNPNLPYEDPTQLTDPTFIVEPPQCSSCFR